MCSIAAVSIFRSQRTDNGEHLSRLYGKGNILENLHLSKMLLQVFNF